MRPPADTVETKARQRPELVRSDALLEPAVAGDSEVPPAPQALLATFERCFTRGDPEHAAEIFHRRVLSDALWRRLSPDAQARARGQWRQIHGDLAATVAYRVPLADLSALDLPSPKRWPASRSGSRCCNGHGTWSGGTF